MNKILVMPIDKHSYQTLPVDEETALKLTEEEFKGLEDKIYQFNDNLDGLEPYIEEIIPEPPEYITEQRINELIQKLNETDYQAIKHSEGVMSDEEYEPIKVQRQAWRDEINQLEQ